MIELPLTGPAWVFLTVAVLLLVAPLAAERLRLPGVIGLVISGLVVGPEGLGLLSRQGTIEQLGGFGLLYLMFLAALELDLEELSTNRRPTVVFGLITFAIPMTLGTGTALALGFGGLASVLIGSLWASHTLVTYPIIRRSGIVGDPSVTATIGATVITDTLALIVLALVAASFETGGGFGFLATLLPGLAILGLSVMWLLPRITQWFFAGIGQDRTVRFLFVLTAFLASAVLAEVVGVEGIVGAFLAGLALNRAVPNRGALMQRVDFVGSAFLVPIFLISVGMLVDVSVVLDPETLLLAVAFATVAISAKWAAAEISGRVFSFGRAQIGVMFALSNSQAAATLAATIVGFELGLIDERVVNAVLIVILVTVTVASWVASRSAHKVAPAAKTPDLIGKVVLAPVARPETMGEILRLGVWVARADGGHVVPFHVVTSPESDQVEAAEPLMRQVNEAAARLGADVEAFVRVDRSVAAGVVSTVAERAATLVLLGWKGESTTKDRVVGSLLEDVVDRIPCATAVCWLPGSSYSRLVLIADGSPTEQGVTNSLCRRLARGAGLPVTVVGEPDIDSLESGWELLRRPIDFDAVEEVLGEGDVVLMSGGSTRPPFGSLAQDLVEAHPSISVIVVSPPTSPHDFGLPELFAGG